MENITPKLDQKLVDEFNNSPISLTYLKSILKNDGRERRQLLKDKSDKKDKNIILSMRTVTNILEDHIIWAVLGNDKEDWQKSALYFYNPESGIYEKNTLLIEELINIVEPQITERNIKEVKSKLRIEGKRLFLTNDPNLYALGNGIFDAKKHKLLAYSPKYVFTSKRTDMKIFNKHCKIQAV